MLAVYGRGPSASALAEALDCVRFSPDVARRRTGRLHIVNWGAVYEAPHTAALNQRIVFNKYRQLDLMRQGGVPTPAFTDKMSDITLRQGERWLGRRFSHVGGRDIAVYQPTERRHLRLCTCDCGHQHQAEALALTWGNTDQRDFYTLYIPKDREFRVHVFGGAVLRIAEKEPNDRAAVAWGNEHAHFRYYQNDGPRGLRDNLVSYATNAVNALNMDFGAVDVIWKRPGQFWVLEVNSAPSIYDNQHTLEAYRAAVRRWYERV